MYVKSIVTAPDLTKGKKYNVIKKEITNFGEYRYRIVGDSGREVWCLDEEVREIRSTYLT